MATEVVASSAHAAFHGGTAAKALALANPMGIAVVGGMLIGAGGYWALSKMLVKDAAEMVEVADAVHAAHSDDAAKVAESA